MDGSWENPEYVECCVDEEYMSLYIEESEKLGIDYRILLCLTNRNAPILSAAESDISGKFLEYDYAYSGGSYYSCILNDIFSERIEEFKGIKLNEYGLFSSFEQAEKFGKYRENLKSLSSEYIFEEGDFVIYKLVEVNE